MTAKLFETVYRISLGQGDRGLFRGLEMSFKQLQPSKTVNVIFSVVGSRMEPNVFNVWIGEQDHLWWHATALAHEHLTGDTAGDARYRIYQEHFIMNYEAHEWLRRVDKTISDRIMKMSADTVLSMYQLDCIRVYLQGLQATPLQQIKLAKIIDHSEDFRGALQAVIALEDEGALFGFLKTHTKNE